MATQGRTGSRDQRWLNIARHLAVHARQALPTNGAWSPAFLVPLLLERNLPKPGDRRAFQESATAFYFSARELPLTRELASTSSCCAANRQTVLPCPPTSHQRDF